MSLRRISGLCDPHRNVPLGGLNDGEHPDQSRIQSGYQWTKKLARRGPVFITDRGLPAYVLLTIENYRRLTCADVSLAETLAQTGNADFEFEPPRLGGIFKLPDLE